MLACCKQSTSYEEQHLFADVGPGFASSMVLEPVVWMCIVIQEDRAVKWKLELWLRSCTTHVLQFPLCKGGLLCQVMSNSLNAVNEV